MLTIPSPNTDRSLLSLADMRAAAGVTDGSRDTELTALAGYISAVITRACKIATAGAIPPTLRLETVIETIRPRSRMDSFSLARGPIDSVTSFLEGGIALTQNTDYVLEGRTAYRLTAGQRSCWPFWPTYIGSAIVVEYAAGYDEVPDDLKYAAIKFMQEELSRGSRDRYLRSRTVPGVLEQSWWVDPTRDQVIPPEVLSILEYGDYVNKWGWMV